MKKVLVINIGWEQEPLLDKLVSYDVEIYGIHYDNDYYKKAQFKDVFITDLRDLNSILNYANKVEPDAVISDECDYSYFAQALIAETFNLPGPNVKEAQIATNKYLQRVKSKNNNLLIPDFKLCSSSEDVTNFADKYGYPIIVKPVDNRGSFGVNKIINSSQILDSYNDALVNSHSRLVLVEKFIEGVHITVDGYVFKNEGLKSLAVASKTLTNGDKQVAIEIQYPAPFKDKLYNQVLKVNERVNQSLGFSFGMTHSEYMIDKDNNIYLIESANRGGGVYTSEIIVPNVCGIDIVEQYICDVLAIEKNYYSKIEANKVVLKFFNLSSGKIKSISGVDCFSKREEVLKFKLFLKEGDMVKNITNDANRHGFIIAKNSAMNIDEEIEKDIKITYEK